MQEGRKPGLMVIRHAGATQTPPPLIVKYKRPSEWTALGKEQLQAELRNYLERLSGITQYDAIYGVAGIGLHWMVYKMDKSGGQLELVLDWQDEITSDKSYEEFQTIAKLVHDICPPLV
jgi:hypothetical protein